MARVEPMDVDSIESDFEDKENSMHNSNVFTRSFCTEKGYEELDVSELNMKLKYSITPTSSPMSKSYTSNCNNYRGDLCDSLDNTVVNYENNLTRSLNSTMTISDNITKPPKLPLQSLPTEQFVNDDISSLVRRSYDIEGDVNVLTIGNENDDNISVPSTSSSTVQTPEATTPTKDITKSEESPIMRGLKSVLNMFRPSQSPIPSSDDMTNQKNLSPIEIQSNKDNLKSVLTLASTPIASNKIDNNLSKRSSPLKESVIFNNDLERELQWKDETTIFLKDEKVPAHKLFSMQPNCLSANKIFPIKVNEIDKFPSTVENMDQSDLDAYNKYILKDNKLTADFDTTQNLVAESGVESDNEFVDCETTYTKNELYLLDILKESTKTSNIENIQEEFSVEGYAREFEITPVVKNSNNDSNITGIVTENVDLENSLIVSQETSVPQDITTMSIFNNVLDITDVKKLEYEICNKESLESNTTLPVVIEPHLNNSAQRLSDQKSNITKDNINSISDAIENLKVSNSSINKLINTTDMVPEHNDNPELLNQNHIISANLSNTKEEKTLKNTECEIAECSDINVKNMLDVTQENVNNGPIDKVVTQVVNVDDIDKKIIASNENKSQKKEKDIISNDDNLEFCNYTSDIIFTNIDITNKLFETNTVKPKNSNSSMTEFVTTHQSDIKDNIDKTINIADESVQNEFNILFTKSHNDIRNENDTMHRSMDNSVPKLRKVEMDENVTGCCVSLDFDGFNKNNDDKLKGLFALNCTFTSDSQKDIVYNKIDLPVNNLEVNTPSAILQCPMNTSIYDERQIDKLTNFDLQNKIALDIPVPNYDDIDKDSSADPCSIKNSNPVILIKENEISSGKQESIDKSDSCIEYKEVPIQTSINSCKDISVTEKITTQIMSKSTLKTESNFMDLSNIVKSEQDKDTYVDILTKIETLTDDSNPLAIKLEDTNINVCEKIITDISNDEHYGQHNVSTKINDEINLNKDTGVDIFTKIEILSDDVHPLPIKMEDASINIDEKFIADILNVEPYEQHNVSAKINDEINLTSVNNSPNVVITDIATPLTGEQINNPYKTRTKILSSPPISPKPSRKGYNINFDEIDDPFATKTNIRMSPPAETTFDASYDSENEKMQNINNNKILKNEETIKNAKSSLIKVDVCSKNINTSSQYTETNKSIATKLMEPKIDTKFQTESDGNSTIINHSNEKVNEKSSCLSSDVDIKMCSLPLQSGTICSNDLLICKTALTSIDISESHIDSNEQNTLSLTADNTSRYTEAKSVFNLPEISDNFKNIVNKSEICQSPVSHESTISKLTHSEELQDTEPMNSTICNKETTYEIEKVVPNIGNTTSSSTNTDERNGTVHEVHTEDEDTIEGPFLDVEEFSDVVKVSSDFEKEKDIMDFENLSPSPGKENIKNELFIDAEAFEFLLNQNKSNVVVDSGKESLFLKFDPLFAKRVSSDKDLIKFNAIRKKQSTPKKIIKTPLIKVPHKEEMTAGPSHNINIPDEFNDEIGNVVSKPMMVVNPAINPAVSPRKSMTPPRVNRQSLTFTSPAMVVINRLLSLSGNTSSLDNNTTLPETNGNYDTDIALIQLRELLAEKELQVFNLRCESREFEERLATLEIQVTNLESEGQNRLRKISDLNKQLSDKTKTNKCMASVVEEYERTLATLIAEIEQDKKRNAEEKMRLIREKDEQAAHLATLEVSFNDLHNKYEKSKQIIFDLKANEDIYKKSLKKYEDNYIKMQNNYELLKQHATTKLNHANSELDKINRAHEAEVVKITTMLKRKEIETASLEESLMQKINANKKLTAICDELISKVG